MNNPKIITNGNNTYHVWENNDGEFHREDEPAYICYYDSNKIYFVDYFINGKLHRADGADWIKYNGRDGDYPEEPQSIKREMYYYYGKDFKSLEELQNYAKHVCLS